MSPNKWLAPSLFLLLVPVTFRQESALETPVEVFRKWRCPSLILGDFKSVVGARHLYLACTHNSHVFSSLRTSVTDGFMASSLQIRLHCIFTIVNFSKAQVLDSNITWFLLLDHMFWGKLPNLSKPDFCYILKGRC